MERQNYSARMRRAAWHAYTRNLPGLLLWTLWQAAVRLIALSPVILSLCFSVFSVRIALVLSLLLYIFLVYPMRFRSALTLTRMVRWMDASSLRPASYLSRLGAGVIRMLSGMVWGIPFAALIYRLYQYIFVFPGSRFNQDFRAIGAFLNGSAADDTQLLIGSIVFFGMIFLSLLLFLCGWHRGVAYDFQLVGDVTPGSALRNARRVRRLPHVRRALLKCALTNALLCLPAIILPLTVPYGYLRGMLTGSPMQDLQLLAAFFRAGMISGGVVYITAAVFLVLYLPLFSYRKLRNAAVVVNAYADEC